MHLLGTGIKHSGLNLSTISSLGDFKTLQLKPIYFKEEWLVGFGWDYLKFKLAVKAYTYSKSKDDLQKAYSSLFLNTNSTSLVSTIGGLPENSLDLGINYFGNDLYSFELFYGTSLLIITDNKDQRLGASVTRYFNSFSGNIGFSQNKTESQQSNSLLIGAAIDF